MQEIQNTSQADPEILKKCEVSCLSFWKLNNFTPLIHVPLGMFVKSDEPRSYLSALICDLDFKTKYYGSCIDHPKIFVVAVFKCYHSKELFC